MPDDKRRDGWGLAGVEVVPDPEKNLPPWERSNPAYGVGAGKDEKATHNVSARLTTKEHRDIAKIVQHRKFPVIENTSDAIRVALMMLRYWYATKHDEAMLESLDTEMWENERLARLRERTKVLAILEGTASELSEAERMGYTNRVDTIRAELNKYRKKLTDEELKGKADKLYVQSAPKSSHMKPMKST